MAKTRVDYVNIWPNGAGLVDGWLTNINGADAAGGHQSWTPQNPDKLFCIVQPRDSTEFNKKIGLVCRDLNDDTVYSGIVLDDLAARPRIYAFTQAPNADKLFYYRVGSCTNIFTCHTEWVNNSYIQEVQASTLTLGPRSTTPLESGITAGTFPWGGPPTGESQHLRSSGDGRYVFMTSGGVGTGTNSGSWITSYGIPYLLWDTQTGDTKRGGLGSHVNFGNGFSPPGYGYNYDPHPIFDGDNRIWLWLRTADGPYGGYKKDLACFEIVGSGGTFDISLVAIYETALVDPEHFTVGMQYRESDNRLFVWLSASPDFFNGYALIDPDTGALDGSVVSFTEYGEVWDGWVGNWITDQTLFADLLSSPVDGPTVYDIENLTVTYDAWNTWPDGESEILLIVGAIGWFRPTPGSYVAITTGTGYPGASYMFQAFQYLGADDVLNPGCPPCEVDTVPCGDTEEPGCNAQWPFAVLQPATVGVFMVAGNIGGGPAVFGGHEETKPTANGFWRFTYGSIPIHSDEQIRRWRSMQALLAGGGGIVCLHVYDGKRAPWLTVGDPIVASASGTFAAGATNGSIKMTSGAVPQPGMLFSYNDRLYRLKTVGTGAGSPPIYPVTVFPHIRAEIPNNAALEFERPTCRAHLTEPDGMSLTLSLLQHASPSVDFEEDF